VAQLYPRHRVPILVAFYDMHGLQWDYSFPPSPHGDRILSRVAFMNTVMNFRFLEKQKIS